MFNTPHYPCPEGFREISADALWLQYASRETIYNELDHIGPEDPESYLLEPACELTRNRGICEKENGFRAVMLREDIPIFDSCDREWDSYIRLYVYPSADGKSVEAYSIRGGYRIAKIERFRDVRWGSDETAEFMSTAGIF